MVVAVIRAEAIIVLDFYYASPATVQETKNSENTYCLRVAWFLQAPAVAGDDEALPLGEGAPFAEVAGLVRKAKSGRKLVVEKLSE